MIDIWLYNTLTRQKEKLETREEGKVFIYICGPTVYNFIHIGNARCYISFDAILRFLKYAGYKVKYVRNLTDVDDKIIKQANQEGVSTEEISQKYIDAFMLDMKQLNIMEPDVSPKATGHIKEMVTVIIGLIDKGFAYEVDGDVFFEVEKFDNYGQLSNRTLEEMRAGERVDVDPRKRNPMDFALWKKSKEGEPSWKSPWGPGRPGWHIECSTMSEQYLGSSFDIHGGGQDLIFPHHENEIAQYEAYAGKKFVKYWLHNGFVNVEEEKMAKSVGNVILVKDLIKNNREANALRMLFLSSHYRSPINFSSILFKEAETSVQRLQTAYSLAKEIINKGHVSVEKSVDASLTGDYQKRINESQAKFESAMADDFNTAAAIGAIFELAREINIMSDKFQLNGILYSEEHKKLISQAADLLEKLTGVLGFDLKQEELSESEYPSEVIEVARKISQENFSDTSEAVNKLLALRDKARQDKDWALADKIRADLKEIGLEIEDTPLGSRLKVIEQ